MVLRLTKVLELYLNDESTMEEDILMHYIEQ